MTGIEFIVRDRGGWAPPIQYRENNHPEFAPPTPPVQGKPLTIEHFEYIKDMIGIVTVYVLAEQFGVSRGTINNIQSGRRDGKLVTARHGKP